MAEERNLATARAPEVDSDAETTKEELQRRMEEARESITQTVTEIKETVTNQYQNVRESISQTLDWREQYRRRPVAFAAGALGVGAVVGYAVGGALMGESDLVERYYEAEGEGFDGDGAATAQAATRGASMSAYAPAAAYPAATESAVAARPSYSSGYEAAPAATEPDKPGLLDRFKETQAYDRLQQELGNVGNRVVDELSKTAQTVVLPMLLNKLKDLVGLDLSGQRGGTTTTGQRTQTAGGAQANASAGSQPGAQSGGAGNTPTTAGGYGSS